MKIDNNNDLTSTELVGVNLSDDMRFLTLMERKIIDLQGVDLLVHEDERIRQAFHISSIFDKYIDHKRRLGLMGELKTLLTNRFIELKVDDCGEFYINVLRNRGQAKLLRVIIRYFTPQRIAQLEQSSHFNALKHLLMIRIRHQGVNISINSMSVTLNRAIGEVCATTS